MTKTKFINPPTSKELRRALRMAAHERLKSRQEAFECYRVHGLQIEWRDRNIPETVKFFKDHGNFEYYGVEISYIKPGTFDGLVEGYLRYLLCTGGPREEIRFYYSPGATSCYKVTFVYLDGGADTSCGNKGVSLDVTREEWANWVFQIIKPE